MFKFPISSEAEPGWLEWLVCPDCQVWCHNSTGLGREGAGRHHPCLHLHPPGAHCTPLHPSPHCTPALVQRGLHRDTEDRAARPLLPGSGGGVARWLVARCVPTVWWQWCTGHLLQLTLTLAQQNWSCRCSARR